MPSLNPIITALQVLALSSVGLSTVLPIVGPKHYDVSITTFALNDSSRLDPFAKDNRTRAIMASTYLPVSSCSTKKAEKYMPPATAAFQNDKFGAYGLPNGSFSALEVETCASATKSKSCNTNQLPLQLATSSSPWTTRTTPTSSSSPMAAPSPPST
ncbi:predicted protein [Plenodomus lingam JN3]|uniref:Predicted protein n=1 Tax=Leptosphaeria maculans (strain JN3 / isolate v23.1.3 / race Av1-4-5-6-7-8) TaxID=985895 RepID=E5A8X4_LEPMJ|nr:predicted protein [Plenodomus lingam JN3]CBY00069.1 predicted protein [Plenodomus lingam JN3]